MYKAFIIVYYIFNIYIFFINVVWKKYITFCPVVSLDFTFWIKTYVTTLKTILLGVYFCTN